MGASPEQLHRLGHHDCDLCKAEKKTKAEERLIKEALILHAAMAIKFENYGHKSSGTDVFSNAAIAILKKRNKK